MRILMTGGSGLIGRAVGATLRADGGTVNRFTRPGTACAAGDVAWNPETGEMNSQAAEGADVIVNLAGASIGGGRWTSKRKALLRSSRVDLTERLIAVLVRLQAPPKVFVSASAIGFYGRSRRGIADRSQPQRPGFPGSDMPRLGSGSNESRAIRRARHNRAFRYSAREERRRVAANDDAVQVRGRRKNRIRETMDVLGSVRRCSKRGSRCSQRSGVTRPSKCSRPESSPQRRVYENPSASSAPAGDLPSSSIRAAPSSRRNGRRAALIEPARRTREACAPRLSISLRGT